ncbi:carbohydrate ABC transporter permease [Loktanella salsilacus]|jgi:putative aldouronate transport system permease protein|uniref:Carbohydrate ABC transporter membrane protein 2, CUT1 family n=1 Tax=Loktanella salsilacus TaxID=195913 RepID=A0A1I4HDQ1_9RHOB|nr:carbohydrate ABC transporter permease [Loktanella salsilacus]MBU0861363.1 carbohydrate ABC transporter permease [Alphaproteobacteria bacterium]UTH44605.1 carbohydrate ABC transporter permease [Loktanella salsilacus]SFL39773.1 carbohydrate ABC transporter membrane protein 2, CUT1 family [Loktanella salsilacus]|tara:strand:+ start:3430 stop:4311 length:882 start_codon:yes stop_codon:yes gene_type:complete
MAKMNLYSRGDKAFVILNMVLIGMFTISALYPFIYIASLSMSSGFEARAGNVLLTPVGFTLEAYSRVLSEPMFWISYKNTFIYTIGGTLMSLAFIIPGAYALSRPQLYGRRFWNLMVAFTMWFHAGMIPFFLNMRDLNLLDSYFGIIIGFAVSGFNIILLRNFFEGIPQSFEEAARMDGANEFQVLWKVYMPLSKPAIATVALFCIVSRWNGFFWAMILLQDEGKIPLQVYLRHVIMELSDDEEFASTLINAAYSFETVSAAIIVCSIIPILLIYPFLQKYFNKGILLGGVKE